MARTNKEPQSSKSIYRQVPSNPKLKKGKFKLRKSVKEKKAEVPTRKSTRLASSSQKLAAADSSESSGESSSSSDSSSSSKDEDEPNRGGSSPKIAMKSNDTINLNSNISPNTSPTSISQPIAEGYPSSTSYGERFEILLRGVLDPKERGISFGNWLSN